MTQFDIFANPIPASRRHYPLLVSLQSTLLADRSSQVVAPLVPRRNLSGAAGGSRLAPVVKIDDDEYIVLVPALMTLPAGELPRRIANLSRHREALLGAVDLLFYGV
jgi:toxin CcdB